jgi:hypothetical protein
MVSVSRIRNGEVTLRYDVEDLSRVENALEAYLVESNDVEPILVETLVKIKEVWPDYMPEQPKRLNMDSKYPLQRIPRPEGGTRYDEWQGHPLQGCSQEILDIARKVLSDAVMTKDVSPVLADPIADAVVAALREAGYLNG